MSGQSLRKSGWKSLRACCSNWRVFAVAGILMMCYGVSRGESFSILQKAANICLECIGIG